MDGRAVGELDTPGDERQRVRAWRLERFLILTGDRVAAEMLADSDADLHDVERLLACGATIAQVLRIRL